MGKAIKSALIAAAVVALVVVTAGAAGAPLSGIFATTSALGGLSVAMQFAIATFATTLISAGIGMMTSKGIDAVGQNFGTKITNRNNLAARQIIYGETRVAGTITFMRTTGTDNNKLSMYIVYAGHEVEGFTGLYINEKLVTTSSSTSSGAGTDNKIYTVTSSDYTNSDNDHNFGSGRLIRFTFNDGSQTSHDALARSTHGSSIIDNNFILSGVAYMYIELIYDSEKNPQLPNINMRIKGKKVYDPRTTSVAWSDNPALCIRDYLTDTTYGLKATSDEVNDTANAGGFQSAANTCEQSVSNVGGVTEERYTANGFTNFSANGTGVIEGLLSAMGGKLTFTNGKFNVFVGAAQTPSLTITDDDLLTAVSVTRNTASNELFNSAKSVYVDRANNYVATDSPELTSSTGGTAYIAIDTPSGEAQANYKKRMEVQLPFTQTVTTAERLTKIALQHQRETEQISMTVTTKFLRLQPADWVYVTNDRLEYSQKAFEVLSTQLEFIEQDGVPLAACKLTLKSISAATYDFVTNDFITPVTDGSVNDVPTGSVEISAPTSLTLSQILVKEGQTSKINVLASWSENTSPFTFAYEVAFKTSNQSSFQAVQVGRGTNQVRIPNVAVGETYNIKVRAISTFGTFSAYTSVSNITITAATEAPSAPTNISASTGKELNIVVTFTNSNSADLKAVKIYRKTTTTNPTSDTDGLIHTMSGVNGQVSTFVDGKHNGLTAGVTYYYWAKAVNTSDVVSSLVGPASGSFINVATATIPNQSITNAQIAVDAIQANVIQAGTITATELGAAAVTTAKLANDAVTAAVVAAGAIGTSELGVDAVTAAKIADNAVTADQIAADAVTTAKIANDAITTDLIAAGAITATEIGADAVTTAKIANDAITTDLIAAGAITTTEIGADAITTAKIAANAITATEINAGAITSNEIAANTITAGQIATGAISTDELAANAITAAKIAANTITASELAANSVTASEIAANAVTASEIAAGTITASEIAAGAITATELAADSVTANAIATDAVTADAIAANTITAAELAANSVTASEIAANAVTASEIAANTITAGQIAAGAIDTDELAADAVTAAKITANTITASEIAAGTITASEIAAGTITASEIAAGAIGANQIAANAVTAAKISVTNLAAVSANMGTITAGTISGGTVKATTLEINGATLTADANGLRLNLFDAFTHINADTMGKIGGTSGQSESGNSQNITVTEISRSIWGDNGFPDHISGVNSTASNPTVNQGDVMGANSSATPLFSFNFTTSNFSGSRDFIVQTGLDFTGTNSSGVESVFAVAMRATTSASNFTSTNTSDYVFTDNLTSSGSFALGARTLNAKVSLTGNQEYYIWCFGMGDDGVQAYKSGFINVFGLNK